MTKTEVKTEQNQRDRAEIRRRSNRRRELQLDRDEKLKVANRKRNDIVQKANEARAEEHKKIWAEFRETVRKEFG